METTPLVSIVIPVYNDEETLPRALDSCLAQTMTEIEVIIVDDASTDRTVAIAESYAARDQRVRLICQAVNKSAYQARREGILAARAERLLFLDGDDELTSSAAEHSLAKARSSDADLVQFGIDVVRSDGSPGGGFEERLQPRNDRLSGIDVLRGLFPLDQSAQGHLWRFLFRTSLIRDAYALVADDVVLPRVNDLPITFLVATLASSYVSLPDRLYRYNFGQGGSGQKVDDLERVHFYAGAINSITTIAPAVEQLALRSTHPEAVRSAYEAVRLSIIGYTTRYLGEHTTEHLRDAAFAHLFTCAPPLEIVQGTARFWPGAIDTLAEHSSTLPLTERPVRSVLLTTNVLRTGGVSGVLISQATLLLRSGFRVTIVAQDSGSDRTAVPPGAEFVETVSVDLPARLSQWSEICRTHDVDLVIDHHWMYSSVWPALALAARVEGVATIGWAHNFAARYILLGIKGLDFQTRHARALSRLVVLSPLDVAFWKLRGVAQTVYLPNPPSPLLRESLAADAPKTAAGGGKAIELVWWGRLEQRTKRVSEFVSVASALQDLGVDFRLRIIGPDWSDMSAAELRELARLRGVDDRVEVVGPLYGDDLVEAIDSSDMFVNVSAIEGYPLTLPEAQARGLPVVMYDLPWLALNEANGGVVRVKAGDPVELAQRIADIAADPARYARLSQASIEAARRELSYDFDTLYRQLVTGDLPRDLSPEPSLRDAQMLIDLVVAFDAQNRRSRDRVASSSRRRIGEQTAPSGFVKRAVATLTPAARSIIEHAPWLRGAARKVKRTLAP